MVASSFSSESTRGTCPVRCFGAMALQRTEPRLVPTPARQETGHVEPKCCGARERAVLKQTSEWVSDAPPKAEAKREREGMQGLGICGATGVQ
eukprot:1911653-Pyramimonas_sp.AAC.1